MPSRRTSFSIFHFAIPRAAEGVGPYKHQCTGPPYFIFHFQFSIIHLKTPDFCDILYPVRMPQINKER